LILGGIGSINRNGWVRGDDQPGGASRRSFESDSADPRAGRSDSRAAVAAGQGDTQSGLRVRPLGGQARAAFLRDHRADLRLESSEEGPPFCRTGWGGGYWKAGKRIRFLRMVFEPLVLVIPKSAWLATHIASLWNWHSSHEAEGRLLEDAYLARTTLVPERVTFPPTRVKVGAGPGWIVVSAATERVERTLHDRINQLARASGDCLTFSVC
jgi:hypothetical protein